MDFVVYLVSYKLISKYKSEDMKEPTNNLFRVVGMLTSLMLALAFSEVIVEQRTIRNAIQRKTTGLCICHHLRVSGYDGMLRSLPASGAARRARFSLHCIRRPGAVSRSGIERSVSRLHWYCADPVRVFGRDTAI